MNHGCRGMATSSLNSSLVSEPGMIVTEIQLIWGDLKVGQRRCYRAD